MDGEYSEAHARRALRRVWPAMHEAHRSAGTEAMVRELQKLLGQVAVVFRVHGFKVRDQSGEVVVAHPHFASRPLTVRTAEDGEFYGGFSVGNTEEVADLKVELTFDPENKTLYGDYVGVTDQNVPVFMSPLDAVVAVMLAAFRRKFGAEFFPVL